MFGTLKKLFSKSAAPAMPERIAPTTPARPAFAPAPAREAAPQAASAPAGPQATAATDSISIPMAVIVPKLSGHLASLAIRSGGTVFHLPVSTALEQLPSGRVRVPFGQLRRGVPHGTFADNETHDEVMVELPLSPILQGMSPVLLARRAQKKVEVPPEVVGVFGPKGSISAKVAAQDVATASAAPAMAVVEEPVAPPPAPPTPAPFKPAAPPTPARAPVAGAPAAPATPISPLSRAPVTPISPIAPSRGPATPMTPISPIAPSRPMAPISPIAPEPVAAAPVAPIAPAIPAPKPGPIRVTLPTQKAAAPVAPMAPISPITPLAPTPISPISPISPVSPISPISPIAPAPVAPIPASENPPPAKLPSMGAKPVVAPPDTSFIPKTRVPPDVVAVPLSEISEGWADPVRQEIALGEWDLALVMFPVSRLEAGMKVGRLNFTWGEIRLWLNPPIGSIPSPHVDVPVELPLKVIAPLFMAARRPTGQKKVEFDETIPDVFTGLKQTAAVRTIPPAPVPTGNTDVFGRPTAVPTPSVPSAPMAMPMPTPTPAVVSHAPRPDGLGAIFGQPLKSEWSPAEITQKVSELSGVAGSLLTMADGLLVAGQVPAPQKAETLAAFMPQIFSRLTQYGGEMQLGALGALTMSTADGPCAIYKAGRLYLGVVGRAGQNLPEAQLQRIASEIAKRNP